MATHPEGLADHHGSPNGKDGRSDVDLPTSGLVSPEPDDTERHVMRSNLALEEPSHFDPIGHCCSQKQRRRDRQSLKVFALSTSIRWDQSDSRIEPSQPGQSARDEPKERNRIEGSTEPERKCQNGRCDTERNEIR